MKRLLAIFLGSCILLAGCGMKNQGGGATAGTNITFLSSKGEIQSALEDVMKEYEKEKGVKVEVTLASAGTSPYEKISTMYNAGNPPTMAMLDTIDVVQIAGEKAIDLSGEKWVQEANQLVQKIDGKIYSFPIGLECKGLLYNKTVIDETLGIDFKPENYATLSKLRELFKQLSAAGVAPVVLTKEDWSLGSHYFGLLYNGQSEKQEDIDAFLQKLKAGEVNLADNKVFNDVMNGFDLLKEYNINKANPLAAEYSLDPTYFVDGKAAFWFNGNWVWPNMAEFVDENDETRFGMMPMPLNDDPNYFANNNFVGTSTKQIMIDRIKATEEQKNAAKELLNWFVYDTAGQKAMVEKLALVPCFSNITLEASDPLGKVLQKAAKDDRMFKDPVIPSDHWAILGAQMQRYLGGQSTREDMAKAAEAYWKAQL